MRGEFIMYKINYDTQMLKKHGGIFTEHTSIETDKEIHTNPHMLLIYVAHATQYHGCFICNNKRIELSDNDILLINPNTNFSIYSFAADSHLIFGYHSGPNSTQTRNRQKYRQKKNGIDKIPFSDIIFLKKLS